MRYQNFIILVAFICVSSQLQLYFSHIDDFSIVLITVETPPRILRESPTNNTFIFIVIEIFYILYYMKLNIFTNIK